jgi:ubiquinol-cytochrome c reductase iron-sulfur subunit
MASPTPRTRGGREWAPDGLIAFSKVCTHAGCPVGLYEASSHQLLCPCHQSAFDVLRGARPSSGPADRALPQLPLMIDTDGVLRARGDFSSPVGPRTWNLS